MGCISSNFVIRENYYETYRFNQNKMDSKSFKSCMIKYIKSRTKEEIAKDRYTIEIAHEIILNTMTEKKQKLELITEQDIEYYRLTNDMLIFLMNNNK